MSSWTDDDLREWWRKRGGRFHGPNVETGTMPEAELLPLLREVMDWHEGLSVVHSDWSSERDARRVAETALRLAKPVVELAWARNPGQLPLQVALAAVGGALEKALPAPPSSGGAK